MTPEERAQALFNGMFCYDDERMAGLYGNDVVAAFRAAENDALERAALRITRDHSWAAAASLDTAEVCAREIRALKHPDQPKA